MLNKIYSKLNSIEKKVDRNYELITNLRIREAVITCIVVGILSMVAFLFKDVVKQKIKAKPQIINNNIDKFWVPAKKFCPLPNNGTKPCKGVRSI